MTASFRPLVVGLLLAGLFAFALINAGLLISINNGANQSIGDDPAISSYSESLEETLLEANENANATETAFGSSPITLTTGSLVFDAVGGIWKTMKEVPVTVYNLTFGLIATKIFGDESYGVVFGVIGAILMMTIIFGIWKWVTTGESG